MAVNGGEVEIKLKATDNMSAAVKEATQNVAQLRQQIAELGETGGQKFEYLNSRLYTAQETLGKLKMAGTEGGAAVEVVGEKSDEASKKIEKMDSMAERLVMRIALLYALKGTLQFIQDVDENAAALVRMNSITGLSLDMLQRLQTMSEQLSIPFQKTTTAIDFFTKAVSEGKKATVEELDAIGLSLGQVVSLDADDRLRAVAEAIDSLPTPTARAKAEFILFGTDGIAPLIDKFKELNTAQAGMNNLNEQQVGVLARTRDAWAGFAGILKWELGTAMANATIGFSNWVASADNASAALLRFMMHIEKTPKDIQDMLDRMDKMKPTSDGIAEALAGMNQQFAEQEALEEKATKAAKPYVQAWADLATIGENYKETLKSLTPEQDKVLRYYLEAGATVGELAKAFPNLEIAQIKAVDTSIKEAEKYVKAWVNAQKVVDDLWAKAAEVRTIAEKQSAIEEDRAINARNAQLQKLEDARYKAGKESANLYYQNLAASEYQNFQRHEQLLKTEENFDIQLNSEKLSKELIDFDARYAKGTIDEDQYQSGRMAITDRYATLRGSIEDKFNTEQGIRHQIEIDKELAADLAAINAKKQMKELEAKQEAKARADKQAEMDKGGTFDVPTIEINESNKTHYVARLKQIKDEYAMFPGRAPNGSGPTGLLPGDSYGWSAMLREQTEYLALKKALPGYADGTSNAPGGLGVVGERGPEIIDIPAGSSISPTGMAPGGRGGDTYIFNVNGSAMENYMQIKRLIMHDLKNTRQFPAA